MIENVIFTILSERKLGPKLLGVFAGGRIEEYIPVSNNGARFWSFHTEHTIYLSHTYLV